MFTKSRSSALSLALVVAFLCVTDGRARAQTLSGRVVGIDDGDTLTVLDANKVTHVIRLSGIDAPEKSQAFGQRSKQSLSQLAFGKNVDLDCGKEESYGRLVCKVILDGRDICLEQVKTGMAWHYKQFQDEQSPAERKSYADAEDAAHGAHLGLWSDAHPNPPWDFRHGTSSALQYDSGGHRIAGGPNGHVRGNSHTHIYQWPGCPTYDAISERNRVDFANAAAAQAAGFRPARNCL
jgi:endonuclease YncB( thermonuclease family)